ncbi:hypothetical protein ACFOGI_15775 [Virgibacillus xinjiangensis]|uniref:Uncharacterized protein n=1 Tax=Virgibacillus xinjiangensis TaxID=393090 RepID=A0ABV7CZG1_9BACI
MDHLFYLFYSIAYLGLLVWGTVSARPDSWWNPQHALFLVMIGLVYDNSILALGRVLEEGTLLENLSYARYWIHALLTPTLVLYGWKTLERAGFSWAYKSWVAMVVPWYSCYVCRKCNPSAIGEWGGNECIRVIVHHVPFSNEGLPGREGGSSWEQQLRKRIRRYHWVNLLYLKIAEVIGGANNDEGSSITKRSHAGS